MSMMLDKYHIREMINSSYQKKLGLHLAAIEFQRDVLENNFQIEKNYGCKYLSMLGVKHKEDTELIEAAKDFMFTCMKCYVTALKMRHKMYKSGTLQGPSSNESMSRTSIMEFFEGCNALSKFLFSFTVFK